VLERMVHAMEIAGVRMERARERWPSRIWCAGVGEGRIPSTMSERVQRFSNTQPCGNF
jgi:hypothetical protein